MEYKFCVLTISDKGYSGDRADESGKILQDYLENKGFLLSKYAIVPDEMEMIRNEIINMSDNLKPHLILTTGGTGFSKRDITPEATKTVIERDIPGIPEAIRAYSMNITKRAMLSRATCGIRGNSIILNLPGSPKAVMESLEYVIDSLIHGMDILNGNDGECARK